MNKLSTLNFQILFLEFNETFFSICIYYKSAQIYGIFPWVQINNQSIIPGSPVLDLMTEDLSQVCFGSISNYRWPPKNIRTTSPEKSTINGTGMPVKKRTNKFKGIIFFCHKLFSQFVVWIEIVLVYKELFHLNCSKLQLNQPLLLRNKTDPEANFANTYNYIYSGACDWTRFFQKTLKLRSILV